MRTTLSEKLAQHFSRLIPFLMHASFFRGIKDWRLEMWTDFWLQAQLFWPFHGLDSTFTMLQKLLWNKTFSKLWLQGKDFKSWQHWHKKRLLFLHVRSLVFKKGQFLEVSHNFLKDASTIDASEYTSMTIFCNYAQKGLKDGCKGQTKTNGLLTLGTSIVGVSALLASLNTLFGHFWWLILIVVAGMVSCSTS